MATLTIRNVDDATKRGLRLRAASRGVSMEEEIRGILRDAVNTGPEPGETSNGEENLYEAIRRLVEPFGGFELDLPAREPIREPPKFE